MKNILHVIALLFAAGLPCTIAAGFAGLTVPAVLGVGYLVLGLSLVLMLQLVLHDYAVLAQPPVVPAEPALEITAMPTEKFPMRLAA